MLNIYKQKRRSLWYLGLVFLLAFTTLQAQAQEVVVTGKVTDAETKLGLPGASVLVVGTTTGTITDADGNFSLSASSASNKLRITISFIGYTATTIDVAISGGSTAPIDVALQPDVRALDEVVVVGSTLSTNKRQLGNTINSVSAKDLEKSGTGNLFGALQGKVPGAQITQNSGDPSGGMTIRLRGVKSLSGDSDPLYVIDGVVSSNSTTNVSQRAIGAAGVSLGTNRMADINPNDIESINILNGAAAAAIYGSRAINGVVVITTKKGKSGKPRFTFSTSFNTNELRKKVPFTLYGKQFWSATQVQHTIANVGSPTTPNTIFVEGNTNPDRYVGTNLVDVTRYDYQDLIFRRGVGTDNYFSVNGGNEKTSYLVSTSYMKNEGIIKGTDFQRYGLKIRVDQQLADWAKLSVGINYINSGANEKPNGNVFYSPINSMTINNNTYDLTQRDAFGNLKAVDAGRPNPLSVIETFDFSQKVNRAISDVQLKLAPAKGLNVDLLAGVDTYSEQGLNYIPVYPYAGVNADQYSTGFASSATNQAFLANLDLNATYEKDFADFKSITTAGFNYQYNRSDFTSASGEGMSPGIKTVSGTTTNRNTIYDLSQFNIYGGFLQQTVGYKNIAFVTFSGRIDGSSKFEKNSTDQFYGKVSGSLVASDFAFWKNSVGRVANSFKIRAALGDAGGLNAIGPYSRFQNVNGVQFLDKSAFTASNTISNRNIKPERMREFEIGADVGLLKDRINIGFTYYNQEISDLIVNYVVASSTGGTSKLDNIGTMTNKGIELSMGGSVIKTRDWGWDVNLIYSRNRNLVSSLGTPRIQIANASGAPVWHVEGQAASVFYGTYFARDSNGQPLLTADGQFYQERGDANTNIAFRDGNGVPFQTGSTSGVIRKVIGNPNPDYTASISTSLRYKSVSLSTLFDAVQGFSVFNADRRTRQGIGNGEYAEKEMKGELPRGYIWSMYSIEEWRIEDGSFVKLREVSLTYNLPPIIKGISNLQLSLTGRNLYSWDSYQGYDPETNAGNNSDRFRATDFGNVPIPRSFQVKLTANF
jgi:TonB-linked SusC/RagA family outer membrane protein